MTTEIPINMTALYERASEVAERVIALNPGMGFALADIIDDQDVLVSALHSPVGAHALITGTLAGIINALAHTRDPLSVIRELAPMDPPGGEITPDDMETAYARIETALRDRSTPSTSPLDNGDTIVFDPFAEDPVHASSQILALVAAGNDIATYRGRQERP